ncbi:hypothetical protein A9C19_05055 [Bacillus weihaiensis]|uniref:DUF3592 domain-containing protein n=1 Tax=Bacillus weihaiensis TaxID=1547283 RepID=A0A1L3MP85_9BACI|nr:hypothetical protein A9C19_05055 [Bacillus weihaiensis]
MNFIRTNNLIRKSVLIKGKIVDFKKKRIRKGTGIQSFIPIIEFVDENDGSVKTFESNSGFTEGKYSIGDILEAWYCSNGDETELIINNWFTKWVGIIFSIIGIILIISWGLWFILFN